VRVLVAGSQEFVEYFEKLRGNHRVVLGSRRAKTHHQAQLRRGHPGKFSFVTQPLPRL